MYEDRLIAYLDILGFSDLVAATARNEDLINVLEEILGRAEHVVVTKRKFLGFADEYDVRVSSFSDSIVISARKKQHEEIPMMNAIERITYGMIKLGRLVRGSMVYGKLVHNDHAVFGPGLIEAWQNEQSAIFPRVVLTNEVADVCRTCNAKVDDVHQASSVVRSQDGLCHLNVPDLLPGLMLQVGSQCLKFIAQATHNDHARRKVIWAIEEWNRALKARNLSLISDTEAAPCEVDLFDKLASIREFSALIPW